MQNHIQHALCITLFICGLLWPASEGYASCSVDPSVKWISVLDEDEPHAGGHIWVVHGHVDRVEVVVDGAALTLIEQRHFYARFTPPNDIPATHTIEIRTFDQNDQVIEVFSGTYTTSDKVAEDTNVVLRKWRELEVFDQPALCSDIVFMQNCYDFGHVAFREAVVARGKPFGYFLEMKTVGGWEVNENVLWPGECSPIVPEHLLQGEGNVKDVRLVAVDSQGNRFRSPDRTPLLGDGGCATSTTNTPTPSEPLLLLLAVVGFGLNRRTRRPKR